jgi:hypothetical protein
MSDELRCANNSKDEWHVSIDSGKIHISRSEEHSTFPPHFIRTDQMRGRSVVARAGDGWLIGFDAGELFGGGLWWTSDDGREKKQLTREDVHAILSLGQELLVFTGLAHLGVDQGDVYTYKPAQQMPGELVKIANLSSTPNAALIERSGTVLIAAQTQVVALDDSNQVRVLVQNRGMGFLYPNSIAEDLSGNVFVGMRFFVLQLRQNPDSTYAPTWYVPHRCTKTKIEDFQCECIAR